MEDEGSASIVTSKTPGGVIGWMESMFITISQTFVGLPLLKLFDYCLYVAEKSAQWSLPSHEISAEENGKVFGKIELVRPLPWLLFLPGLVILRIIRGGLNVGAFLFSYPRVEAIVMVKYLQKSRRRLRAFHLKTAKSSRRRDKILMKSLRLSLSTLFCLDSSKLSPSPTPIKMFVSGLDFDTAASADEKSTTESAGSPTPGDTKRKFSQVSSDSESETVLTQLENYATEDSMEDSDFNPAKCSEQSSTSSSGDEDEKSISLTELEDIKKDSHEFLNNSSNPVISAQSSSSGEKEKNTSAIELDDTQSPVKSEPHDSTGTPNALPLDKTTSDKKTEGATPMNETRVDSPETEAAPSPPPTRDVTDGEANHKRNEKPNQRLNQKPYQRPNQRPNQRPSSMPRAENSSTVDNAPHNQEKKNHQRKKQYYKNRAKYTQFPGVPSSEARNQRE